MAALRLSNFTSLITAMPTKYQAFTAKRETKNWSSLLERDDRAGVAMRQLFCQEPHLTISRSDLRSRAQEDNLDRFVMATLLWGYSSGMHGTHARDIADCFPALIDLLGVARSGIQNWQEHLKKLGKIKGVGLSTYTKFLHFLSVNVAGQPALILDGRIINVANGDIFEDFAGNFSESTYPTYLRRMYTLASELDVDAEQIEFFLFEFGPHLKQPQQR